MKTKLKICGITNLDDAQFCLDAGVDYIGFNSIKSSKRYISNDKIADICNEIDTSKVVYLTDSNDADYLANFCSKSSIQIIQPYSLIPNPQSHLKIFYPIRISTQNDLIEIDNFIDQVDCFILDSHNAKQLGGSGTSFDWSIFKHAMQCYEANLCLAGGISLDNLEQALELKPYMIDIASSVESRAGIKDHNLIRQVLGYLD